MKTKLLQASGLKRLLLGFVSVLWIGSGAFAQERFTVTGTVTEPNGDPFIGVGIVVKGTTRGTISGAEGKFSIAVNDQAELEFSFTGYETQVLPVQRDVAMKVVMQESSVRIDDVVVLGYSTMRKVDVTGTVSSIGGDKLAQIPVATAAEALVGKVAGVRVVKQDGEPGAEIDITVRGGMSITQSNSPLYIVDGIASELGLVGIDPNDIERIDILKDASTTSIYGARGANGVILITTKSGNRDGVTSVTYNGYAGVRQMPRQYNTMNTMDFLYTQYEMAMREGGDRVTEYEERYGPYAELQRNFGNRGVNWQDVMFGDNATYQNHSLSIAGGSQNHSFMVSYAHNSEEGIIINTNNRRNTIRMKFDQNLFKGMKLNVGATFYHNKKRGDMTSTSVLNDALQFRPVNSITGTEEELIEFMEDPENSSMKNPKVTQESKLRHYSTRNLNLNGSLIYKFLDDKFTVSVVGSGTWRDSRDDSFDYGTSSSAGTNKGPFGSQKYGERFNWQNSNTITYANSFGKHNLTAILGNELVFGRTRSLKAENRQFPEDHFGIYDLSLGSNPLKPSSEFKENGLVSYFGQAFYNYDEKYLLTLSLRADGSSKFSRENRWGYFPSASVAWRMSEEKFMEPLKRTIDMLKFRLSYGESGNNQIGDNRYSSIFETGWYTNGASEIPTLTSKALANPFLKWETTISANLGLDLSMFNNRINLVLDAYKNRTKDLLLEVNIPPTTGYEKQTQNIGTVESQGFEITLNTVNIQTKNFQWYTDFNISFNKNNVKNLSDDVNYMLFKSGVGSYMEDFIVQVGQSTGLIYGYVNDGLYMVDDFNATFNESKGIYEYALKDGIPYSTVTGNKESIQPGSPRFKDVDGVNGITAEDRTIIGNTNPKHFGGLNNTFRYKDFDLSIFMNWTWGNKILNYQRARLISTYDRNKNQHSDLTGRFTYIDSQGNYVTEPNALKALNPNPSIHAVKTSGPESNITVTQSDFVEDGSYLRINNVTLGYTLPRTFSKKIHIQTFRIYATVENLYTFTSYSGFDPEVNKRSNGGLTPGIDWQAYPKTRSIVFGVNLTF